ncbi:hypothetical protein L6164_013629 [Bauhinia variegata]|uniref:Uncharacterized protein n=1 Tax=Bauhinia variegata TaxID=167791 RepID=A0ACB9NET1_BAUVA|nr:hypothetical protein L6164_013629 [Bauhinia variegata]
MERNLTVDWSARKLEADDQIPLSDYYSFADELLKKARIFQEADNLVGQYITLTKYSRLCIEIIPYHKDYESEAPEEGKSCKEEIKMQLMEAIDQLLSVEAKLSHRGIDLNNASEEDPFSFLWKEEQASDGSLVPLIDHVDVNALPLVLYEKPAEPSAPPMPRSPRKAKDDGEHALDFHKGSKGLVDKVYMPLLQEVCHLYPSLIECQRDKTPSYRAWALTALGRVLYFLKTTKVADIDDEACECLQLLWNEVEVFGFDLSWLEPQVEFAMKMKGYVEKERKVNKAEEEKKSLELRIQELKNKLAETEKELEISKREFSQVIKELGKQVDTERVIGLGLGLQKR